MGTRRLDVQSLGTQLPQIPVEMEATQHLLCRSCAGSRDDWSQPHVDQQRGLSGVLLSKKDPKTPHSILEDGEGTATNNLDWPRETD